LWRRGGRQVAKTPAPTLKISRNRGSRRWDVISGGEWSNTTERIAATEGAAKEAGKPSKDKTRRKARRNSGGGKILLGGTEKNRGTYFTWG